MDNSKFKIQNLEFSVFHPTYFTSIYQYVKMLDSNKVLFEFYDNFQKQTYRNRCYIYGANGKQMLNIPLQKVAGKQLTKDIQIDYRENWQNLHLKSLQSAYQSSPFFEFYIDDLLIIFNKKEKFLMDLNIKTFQVINDLLPIKIPFSKTNSFQKEIANDFRFLVNSKDKTKHKLLKYTQVFDDKYCFIENLSILDLLFNEGTNALLYLEKKQKRFTFSLNLKAL
jgi:hypothetical protein